MVSMHSFLIWGDKFLEFHNAYEEFLNQRIQTDRSRSKERMELGLQHAEKIFLENVWWPAFRNLKGLHPQYEIRDFKDGRRYIDFAFIQAHFRIAIEIDGMGPHWREISQEKFSDHCRRQNHLVIDGWHVLRFTYKDVQHSPRLCQQTIQQLLGRLAGDASRTLSKLSLTDREIVRFALSRARPVSVTEIATHVQLKKHATIQHLKQLCDTNWLEPANGSLRIHAYRIHPSHSSMQL